MTLEDFFTLNELKDGLTAPARVRELVNVMQKDKNNIVKSAGDTTRQWCTVATTITATRNHDCLALFLELDGHLYFGSWLKEAQKFESETGDNFVEETITAMLGAIERLHIAKQKSVTSGIMKTVERLLSYNSNLVQDKARALIDSWEQDGENNEVPLDVEDVEAISEDRLNVSANPAAECELPESSSHDISLRIVSDTEKKNVEPVRDEMMSETLESQGVVETTVQLSEKLLDQTSSNNGPPDPVCSSDTKFDGGSNSIPGNLPIQLSETTPGNINSDSVIPKQGTPEGKLHAANSNEHDEPKQVQHVRSCDKLGEMDNSPNADSVNALESKMILDVENDVNAKEDTDVKVCPSGDVRTDAYEGKGEMYDTASQSACGNMLASDSTCQFDVCTTDVLQGSSVGEHNIVNFEDSTTYISRKEDTEAIEESNNNDDTDEAEDDFGNDYAFSRSPINENVLDVIDRNSDGQLDYGSVDPLEVARQVALEVERDCSEPSYSSERTSSGGIRLPGSPDSINEKSGEVIHGASEGVATGSNLSSVVGDGAFTHTANLIAEQENCIHDMDASQVTEASRETEPNSDKRICGFDLNEEVLSDDTEHQMNTVAAPISVVSASRAAAASGLPVSPLQFEGTLGWKGSAETSAFRPAPPRKSSEGDKSIFASQSRNDARQDHLDFDLNVAESEDDKAADFIGKEIPTSSGLPSGDSSAEANPKRSNRLQLDLNCVSDGGETPSNCRRKGCFLPHQNGHRSPSPSSSSSSMQPALRNIDLNDQPVPFNDFSVPSFFGKSSQTLCTSRGFKSDDSIISIMGARVEVNRKDFVPQTSTLPNCMISGPAVDASLTRNGSVLGLGYTSTYTHPPVYGYGSPSSGLTSPFSSVMYGQIPCMVDTRGSPVPQNLGSMSALPPVFSQPPFIMTMTGAPSGSNGGLPSLHHFDLNTGLMMDGGNRNAGSLRQLFNPGQGKSADEQMRPNSQPTSSSGVGGKRKETDGGLDSYPFNYKHHQAPWK